MKKKVLFVAHHLTIGGVQKSLISCLNSLDYDTLDVTLYLRKNRTDLIKYINPSVHIIVNDDKTHYYAKPAILALQAKLKLAEKSGNTNNADSIKKQIADTIREMQYKNEYSAHFRQSHFDAAVAYVEGYEAEFVNRFVDADKKYVCFQTAADDLHDLHANILPKFDAIITEHESVKTFLTSCFPETLNTQFIIIPNYTDAEFIRSQADESTPEKGSFTICTCGRMAPVKGFDLAVEAARILHEKGIDFRWYFVGDGPEMDKVKLLISRYHLQARVYLTGMKKNPYPYIKSAEIFVQPSYEEAMSIAVLEAQVLNKPVVTTKTVGGMNIVTDGISGIQTEINAEALADGIIRSMDKNLLDSMSAELSKIDYYTEKERYKSQWAELLS